ncbi:MAG: serine/threonine protein kinase [Pirellulales bacterium]|nr:serine/threonine protein kinase [Pirellulales bacterium]
MNKALQARDELLARMLDELTDRLRAGEAVDVDAVCGDNPELTDELRRLFAAVLIADDVGACVSESVSELSSQSGSARAIGAAHDVTEDSHTAAADSGTWIGQLPRAYGDYELLEEIGRGGMGIVFRARQQSLGRVVALKMILRADVASDTDLARFRSEAQAAARLEHPNVVPVYEVGECEGRPFYTMKHIEGTTLAQRLVDGPLPPREAGEILLSVAQAIQFAHANGVLHRDLKPSNILLDESGRAYVSDFGLAKQVDRSASLTRSGAIMGTPSYMAPEQAAGNRGDVGPAVDIYSLGAILYSTLTGHPPFQAATPVDTVLLLLEQDPPPPRVVNPKADRNLEMIALRCLQKPIHLRYESVDALASDLRSYVQGQPVTARSGTFSQVIARLFQETHHATVLENWGLLWMLHSAALLAICLLTNALKLANVTSVGPYLGLWTMALGVWAAVFWWMRRRAGPVTFVERQIAHVWASSMIATAMVFLIEWQLGLEVLSLSPVLGIVSGSVFFSKAGILSGRFYLQAAALYVTVPLMAMFPTYGISLFGVVSAAAFFLPGLKYYRQRRRDLIAERATAEGRTTA